MLWMKQSGDVNSIFAMVNLTVPVQEGGILVEIKAREKFYRKHIVDIPRKIFFPQHRDQPKSPFVDWHLSDILWFAITHDGPASAGHEEAVLTDNGECSRSCNVRHNFLKLRPLKTTKPHITDAGLYFLRRLVGNRLHS